MRDLLLPLGLVALLAVAFLGLTFSQKRPPPPSPKIQTPVVSVSPAQQREEALNKASAALKGQAFRDVLEILTPFKGDTDPQIQVLLGDAYVGLRDWKEAVHAFNRAEKIKPDDQVALRLVRAYEANGQRDQANVLRQTLSRSARGPARLPVLLGLAKETSVTGPVAQAIKAFERVIQEFPNEETPIVDYVQFLQGIPPAASGKAIDHLLETTKVRDDGRFAVQCALGQLLVRLNRNEDGLQALLKALGQREDARVRLQVCRLLRKAGRPGEALSALALLATAAPSLAPEENLPALFFASALEAKRSGRPDLAFLFLRASVLADPSLMALDDEGTVAAVGTFVNAKGTPDEQTFMQAFQAYFQGEAESARDRLLVALPTMKTGSLREQAQKLLETCKQIAVAHEAARLRSMKTASPATGLASTTRTSVPQPPPSRLASLPLDTLSLALRKEASEKTGDVTFQYETGRKLYALGDMAGSKECFSRALDLRPTLWEAHHCLGIMANKENRLAEAADHLDKAAILKPQSAPLRAFHALVRYQLADIPKALSEAKAALAIDPGNGQAHYVQARILADSNRGREALQEIALGLQSETDPRTVGILRALKKEISGED